MIVRFNKESKIDINNLRSIYNKSLNEINQSIDKINILNKFLKKQRIKNALVKVFSLFIANYQSEIGKLCKEEINREKEKIKNNAISFEFVASPISQTMDKLSQLFNQLQKMKVFYQIDGTFFNYDQIDTNDLEKKYFKVSKKNSFIKITDKEGSYELNSLFIQNSDLNGKLIELFSFDNVKVDTKQVFYFSNKKISGLKLKLQTWLYHNEDYSKNEKYEKNPKVYLYAFRLVRITFKSVDHGKEFTFLGSDIEKMNLFYNLLLEYLEFLKLISFDCLGTNKVEKHKTNELYELFKTNKDYMWVIFDILLSNKNTDVVNIHEIYKKYNLTYSDLLKIVDLLRLYSFFELSLGLELLPIYKYKEVEEKYQEFIIQNKEQLIKGEGYGQ